jgi:hypothetical protein
MIYNFIQSLLFGTIIPLYNKIKTSKNIINYFIYAAQSFGVMDDLYFEKPILFHDYMFFNKNEWIYGKNSNGNIICRFGKILFSYIYLDKKMEKTKKFLSIQYKNLNNNVVIEIELPDEIYFINNCLLSREFLARYFQYHILPIEFSFNYEIWILDYDLTEYKMNPDQYILLKDTENREIHCC